MFDLEQFLRDFFKLPAPKFKSDWVKQYVAMALHTRKGDPSHLICTKRPNETKEVYDYRIKTFKHVTYGSMNRATDELYRIVNGINYRINVDDATREILNGNNFNGMPFALYIQQTVLRRMIEDANGLLVWLPSSNDLSDTSEKVKPVPYLVNSMDIHYIDEDAIAFLSCEKSPVIVNKQEVYEGLVFYIVTKDAFYKLKQIGQKKENRFQSFLIKEHNMGEIPYCVLGGDKADEGYYYSFFAPYLAFGDEALTQFSDFQAIMVTSGFPYIEEFLMECEITEEPSESSNPIPDSEETYKAKRYTWKRAPRSPHNTIERKTPDKNDDTIGPNNILDPSIPSIRFIQADVATAAHAWTIVKEMMAFAEDSLHLNLGRGHLAAAAKVEDNKSKEAMVTKIGDNVFDNLMLNSVRFIDGWYGYRVPDKSISIDKPATYDIKTEQDISNEITDLKKGSAPDFFLQQAAMELARKRFSGNKLALKIFDLVVIHTPLFIYSPAERQQMVLSGTATKEEVIRTQYIFSLMTRIAQEMGIDQFITTDAQKLIDKFEEVLVDYLPEETTPIV